MNLSKQRLRKETKIKPIYHKLSSNGITKPSLCNKCYNKNKKANKPVKNYYQNRFNKKTKPFWNKSKLSKKISSSQSQEINEMSTIESNFKSFSNPEMSTCSTCKAWGIISVNLNHIIISTLKIRIKNIRITIRKNIKIGTRTNMNRNTKTEINRDGHKKKDTKKWSMNNLKILTIKKTINKIIP